MHRRDVMVGIGTRWAAAALLLFATLLADNASAAGPGAPTAMTVRATVKRFASVRVAAPQSLTISESDVARGYVDVGAPVQLTVQSNVPEGYTLVLQQHGDAVREAVVQGLPHALVVASSGTSVSRPAAGTGMWQEELQLRVRFALSPQARPGTHAWPLQISALSY
jgi:hypothetical protein